MMVAVSVLAVGCTTALNTDVSDGPDAPARSENGEVTFALEAGELTAAAPDSFTKEWDLIPAELPPLACDPGEGCHMDKCSENPDCQSGWCVEHMGEKVCTIPCQEECPPGWTCTQVGVGGPDVLYICVSNHPNLCRPCGETDDCSGVAETEDACILYGDQGSFCGGGCGEAGECPWGFECKQVTTVDGIELEQCVAETGECPCTDASVAQGLWTPCSVDNEYGLCEGKRVCLEEGLTDCDAQLPTQEACNGVDDDCDGEADEPELVEGKYVELCDDGNDCTADSCAGEEGCLNELLETGSCDDGNPCTAADHCAQGACVGDPVICEDENPCTDNVCTEVGGCEYPPKEGSCDDGDPCTLGDHCLGGQCSGEPVQCDCTKDEDCLALEDGNLCNGSLVCDALKPPYKCVVSPETVVTCPQPEGANAFCLQSACAPATGECSFEPAHEELLCDDGDNCTYDSRCAQGSCSGGLDVNCNDGNPCTDDACEAGVGCVSTDNSAACSDGDTCTVGDTCLGGVCESGPGLDCDDGDACNGLEGCDAGTGCQAGVPLDCDDGKMCNGWETCDPATGCQVGVPLVCDDGDPCTNDSCDDQSGCAFVASAGNECDDGDACTELDVCLDGVCVGSGEKACADNDPCTDNYCDPTVGCVTKLNEAFCNDGNVCTTGDHCHLGECIGGMELACSDGNPCTEDSCSTQAGCQFLPADGECPGGTCAGGVCVPECPGGCDDANPCTGDVCLGEEGCVSYNLDGPCDDNDPCTETDVCQGGACVGSGALTCNDNNDCTTDTCVPGSGCDFAPNTQPCDDGDLCTTGDQCGAGACEPGAPLNCDDQDQCTEDSCVSDIGCVYTPVDPCEALYLVPSHYATIQEAIDAANPGETVLVADGTYKGTGNKDLNYAGKAVTVRSENGPGVTTIDCENQGRAANFHNGEGTDSVLEGFTITHGSTTDGAGVYCDGTSPTLRNLVFMDNAASGYGGAVYAHQNANPLVQDCEMVGNSANSGGGAIFYKLWSAPTIERTVIRGNTSNGKGGGVCAWDSTGVFRNVLVAETTGNGMGGYFFHNCTTQHTNCTVTANQGGGLEANGKNHTLLNTIFWANPPQEFIFSGGEVTATYCVIQGGYDGQGNQGADPAFVAPGQSDYHLQQGSPCVDQGSAEGAPEQDLEGELRPQGNGVDIGAYESGYSQACQPKCDGKQCGPDSCGGSCGECDGSLICKEGVCDDDCIATGDGEWYGMTGDEWCASLGKVCVGLNFFNGTADCAGAPYSGCWGSKPMPEACCGKSVGGHVGGGSYSAKWKCADEACGDGPPCSAHSQCKGGGWYDGFYWVAAH